METDLLEVKTVNVKPMPGYVFGKAVTGEYETESGILVKQHLKRNIKIEEIKILAIGPMFEVCVKCGLKFESPVVHCPRHKYTKRKTGTYYANIGKSIWMKRAHITKHHIEGATHCFVKNDDIVAYL